MMSSTKTKTLLLNLFILTSSIIGPSQSFEIKKGCRFLSDEREVHVVNYLPQNSNLVMHCNEDNNVTLPSNTELLLSFCSNSWTPKRIVYICRLWWGRKEKVFVAYNERWDKNCSTTGTCYWAALSDGIYFSPSTLQRSAMVKMYDWGQIQ